MEIFQCISDRFAIMPEDIVINYDKYEKECRNKRKENARASSYHAERPVVYITSEDDRKLYMSPDLRVDNSKSHYRSIHYIIRYYKIYFEIQVRTLFEEGWLEFDHRVKYPYDRGNKKKQEFIGIINSLAVAADRLISFYDSNDFMQTDSVDEGQEDKVNSEEIPLTFEQRLINEF